MLFFPSQLKPISNTWFLFCRFYEGDSTSIPRISIKNCPSFSQPRRGKRNARGEGREKGKRTASLMGNLCLIRVLTREGFP